MEPKEYLAHFVGNLHREYEEAIKDLTQEQFQFRPFEDANHIGFTAWHWVRTEDNIVQFVLQRQPTVWVDKGLDTAWNLPRVEQGTGMDPGQAHEMQLPAPADFLDYARSVWERTGAYFEGLTKDELDRIVKVNPFGEVPVFQILGQTLVAHGNMHLGELHITRQFQGKSGFNF
ncbi:MAG: DinB family protein [Dehalococcoidia bacterium]|nr:DinB family protein [Dehalococcoidia bacterium]HJP40584.1 DinB family protein [Dehalococcoidia bacterium]